MRFSRFTYAVFVGALVSVCQTTAKTPAPALLKLHDMKAHAEHVKVDKRAQVYSEIARQCVEVANQQFADGEMENGQASIQEAVSFAEKSVLAAEDKGKKIKNAEINLRETARRIDEVRHSLALDDQPPLKLAEDHIADLRQKLLQHMFGDDK